MAFLKTTLEIPDGLFRNLKVAAARQGKSLRALVNEALIEKLNSSQKGAPLEAPWKRAFGGMRQFRDETARINKVIADEFSNVDGEDWK